MSRVQYFEDMPTDFARRYDGTNYDYIHNPANRSDTIGAMSFWFRVPTLLTANGLYVIAALGDGGPLVGAYGRNLVFRVGRNSAYGTTNNMLELVYNSNGSKLAYKAANVALAANTWYNGVVMASGDIYLNGSMPSFLYRGATLSFPIWFGSVLGSSHDFSFGALMVNGTGTNFGTLDLDDVIYFNDNLTSGEVTQIYGTGTRPPDPASFTSTLQAKIVTYRNWENTLVPIIGSGTLTAVGSPTYIAYP